MLVHLDPNHALKMMGAYKEVRPPASHAHTQSKTVPLLRWRSGLGVTFTAGHQGIGRLFTEPQLAS